ncbi:hypothetical protein BU26DRAFT_129937 [Trematosphaeria pertusa]|uniref:Uncharacterized protein n=1 Tax=Trematosphaeria pertusa TaxID=390896 RepID=A0A6A6HY66_9PLEO|nr:uncharacterized protein BU26DRAFT_129937 [Trematosphaeria pertusa]KAF2242662.1 hypothetical protein BU26DRAFT_129937 [Trematosphaeria pertusa]
MRTISTGILRHIPFQYYERFLQHDNFGSSKRSSPSPRRQFRLGNRQPFNGQSLRPQLVSSATTIPLYFCYPGGFQETIPSSELSQRPNGVSCIYARFAYPEGFQSTIPLYRRTFLTTSPDFTSLIQKSFDTQLLSYPWADIHRPLHVARRPPRDKADVKYYILCRLPNNGPRQAVLPRRSRRRRRRLPPPPPPPLSCCRGGAI